MAFNDGRCGNCNARMWWTGELKDKPACYKCGRKPTAEELDEMEEVEEKLRKMEEEMLKD